MEVWKIIFLSKLVIWRFHVNLPGCYVKLRGGTWILRVFVCRLTTKSATKSRWYSHWGLYQLISCKKLSPIQNSPFFLQVSTQPKPTHHDDNDQPPNFICTKLGNKKFYQQKWPAARFCSASNVWWLLWKRIFVPSPTPGLCLVSWVFFLRWVLRWTVNTLQVRRRSIGWDGISALFREGS